MELTFPFKNYAINSLLHFYEQSYIYKFYDSKMSIEEYLADDFDSTNYQDSIASFENELLQVINTSTQETIDSYFYTLSDQIKYVRELNTKEYIEGQITEWNEKRLKSFDEMINEKTEEYFKSEDRNKAHLEQYEAIDFSSYFLGYSRTKNKTTKTNYNFYCAEEKLSYIDPGITETYLQLLTKQADLFIDVSVKYGKQWADGQIKSKGQTIHLKPIVFFEGEIDVDFITKAAELLGEMDLLSKVELRYRGSCGQLDKLWNILIDNNWETIPQKKILVYDCDTKKPDEDFGHIHRRTMPFFKDNMIGKGIENLFPNSSIEKAMASKNAMIDQKKISGTERGEPFEQMEITINRQEKRNFCSFMIQHGSAEDFVNFQVLFDIIKDLIA